MWKSPFCLVVLLYIAILRQYNKTENSGSELQLPKFWNKIFIFILKLQIEKLLNTGPLLLHLTQKKYYLKYLLDKVMK